MLGSEELKLFHKYLSCVVMEDKNSESSSKLLEWEILGLYGGGGKQSDPHDVNQRQAGLLYRNDNYNLRISSKTSASDSFHCPINDSISGFGKVVAASYYEGATCDDVVRTHEDSIIVSGEEQMINLRLGRQARESGESSLLSPNCDNRTCSSIPRTMNNGSLTPSKRSRASYQNMQSPCCQVEGCNLDLKSAKDYHRRHRICDFHSKSPKVVVGGFVLRFCQQCSRFHDLSEFDDKKRSCRKRLSDHNARRRRLPPESLHLSSSPALSSALYDQRYPQTILLNDRSSTSLSPNSEWGENACRAYNTPRQTSLLVRPLQDGSGLEGTNTSFLHNEIPRSVHIDSCENSSPSQSSRSTRVPDQRGLHITSSGLSSVRSLLSPKSWYLDGAVLSSVNNGVSVMNNNSSETKQWSNGANAIGSDHERLLTVSSSTHMQEHGSCFDLFQPKGFYE